MPNITKLGAIMEPTDNEFENNGVLNPAILQQGNQIHMFYRAVKDGNYSTIGYARFDGPLKIVERSIEPIIFPTEEYESHGIEDPRIVYFENIYYLFYTAYNGTNALVAYAISSDLKKWTKKGIISPLITYDNTKEYLKKTRLKDDYYLFEAFIKDTKGQDVLMWDKDAFIFPEKIKGKIALLHRILPDIQIAYINSLDELRQESFWIDYLSNLKDHILLEGKYSSELRNIGGGAPPIKTEAGWLLIFHTVKEVNAQKVYTASAALLDLDNPQKVIGRLERPLFKASKDWEKGGILGSDNVVFPTGTAIFDDKLYIYYGAADTRICVLSLNLIELIEVLKKKK